MISFKQRGNFNKTEKFLKNVNLHNQLSIFNKYGEEGVNALRSATPIDSSKTAESWSYRIERSKGHIKLLWENSHVVDGVPIAIIIQYGHGTRNGGYVQGRDYINPAITPIFDKISNEIWREVTKL